MHKGERFFPALPLMWLLALVACVQGFILFDWDHGVLRAALLAVIFGLTLGLRRVGMVTRALERRPRWLGSVALAVIAIHVVVAAVVAGASIQRLNTRGLESEMGAINFRALRLVAKGTSPWAEGVLLDPNVFEQMVRAEAAPRCLEVSGDAAMARFQTYWATLSTADFEAASPRFVDGGPDCASIREQARFLGFKYGPGLLFTYAPFVAAFGKAGIQLSHLTWLALLCWLLASWARRNGAADAFEWTAPLWFLLVPSIIRVDMLRYTDCDLAPVLLALAAAAALEREHFVLAGFALGASVSAKLLPGTLFLPLLLVAMPRAVPAFVTGVAALVAPPC